MEDTRLIDGLSYYFVKTLVGTPTCYRNVRFRWWKYSTHSFYRKMYAKFID